MNADTKALLIALCFFAFFGLFFIDRVGTNTDYYRLYNCAEYGTNASPGVEVTPEYAAALQSRCADYPPALIWIFKLFSAREIFLKQFLLFLFAFIAPLVLYKITKEPMVVFFYFACSSFFYAVITASFFAQALGIFLILSMAFMKNWQRIIVLAFSIIIHSTSFYIALFFFFLLLIEEGRFKKALLVCSPFWQGQTPAILDTPVQTPVTHSMTILTWNTVLSAAFKRTPLPFLYFGLKGLWQEKKLALGVLLFAFLGLGIVYHERSLYFAALPMFCGMGFYYNKTDRRMKFIILALSFLWLAFNLWQMQNLTSLSEGLINC